MGIIYNSDINKFQFNFENNSEFDLIEFNDLPLTFVDLGFGETYYFGYEFQNNDNAPSKLRTKFFNELRFNENFVDKNIKEKFVKNALVKLNQQINIHDFDIYIYPKSRSYLNQYMYKILNTVTNIDKQPIELIKKLPSEIEFDWNSFENEVLNQEINGIPKFNKLAKRNAKLAIQDLLNKIHQADYFSIAEEVKKNKYKKFIKPYLYINPEYEDLVTFADNILLIDDVTTTGATLFSAIKAIRILNNTAKIIIFTLIGKKDIQG